MNQKDKVLRHMILYGTITQREAAFRYDIWRLASVINRLKKDGYQITTTLNTAKSGNKYAEYKLAKGDK